MKHWRLLVVAAIIALSSGVVLRSRFKLEAKKKREANYEAVFPTYARTFQPGLIRKDVEERLRANGTVFTQLCCIEYRNAFADLVKIGEEEHPWYCSENYVSIAFHFAAAEPHNPLRAYDTDVLKKVTIFRQLGGCL